MRLLIIPFLVILLSSCATQQFRYGSDFDPNGKFRSYTHFELVNTDESDIELENTITKRLQSQGFIQGSGEHTIFISYRIIQGDATIMGFEQPSLLYWLNSSDSQQAFAKMERRVTGETIIISIYDPTIQKVSWRGYLSTSRNNQSLQGAVHLLMDDFKLLSKNLQADKVPVLTSNHAGFQNSRNLR